jgi:hypothetical protein
MTASIAFYARPVIVRGQHRACIKPIPLRPAVPSGFTIDDFTIDTTAGTITCRQGHTVAVSQRGNANFGPRCRGCPLRDRCTASSNGRHLTVHPHHDAMAAARRHAETEEFKTRYRRHRPMVERSIAWLVADGHRRVRYRGVARNQLGLSLRVAAINLKEVRSFQGHDHQREHSGRIGLRFLHRPLAPMLSRRPWAEWLPVRLPAVAVERHPPEVAVAHHVDDGRQRVVGLAGGGDEHMAARPVNVQTERLDRQAERVG